MTKNVKLKFWLKSNRGTDVFEYIRVRANYDKKELEAVLATWCEGHSAWQHPDNVCRAGFMKVTKRLPSPRYSVRHAREFSWATINKERPVGWYVWDRWNDKTDYTRYPKKRTANDIAEMKEEAVLR